MQGILIADDEPLLRRELRETLEYGGYKVWEASDGEEALEILGKRHPAVLITDILMPDKDGIELIRAVRAERSDVKIVAISSGGAYRFTEFLTHAKKFGADLVYEKPVDARQLLKDLRTSLSAAKG